jgi:hypothetical protein
VLSAIQQPVAVFPLPDTVLFPHTTLPLHVFELRYRTMVRDALSRGRTLALALLKPGWEGDYYGTPEMYPLGCLARIEQIEWLPNDCYDLKITGVTRVMFKKIEREFPYRAARVEPVPELPYPEDDPLVTMEKAALVETFERLLMTLGVQGGHAQIDRGAPYAALVNALCAGAELPAVERLALLSIDSVFERGQKIRELTERRLKVEALARGKPPNEPGPGESGQQN